MATYLTSLVLVVASCSNAAQPVATITESAESSAASTNEISGLENEPQTTADDVLPEFANAVRPTFSVPGHSEYNDPAEAVIDSYLNFVRAELIAFGPPEVDPQNGPWLELTTGRYQESTLERMAEWREDGWVQLPPNDIRSLTNNPRPRPGEIREAEGATVLIDDCFVNSTTVVNRSTGEVIDGGTVTFSYLVEMTFSDGRWKISNLSTNETYEGTSKCPDLQ